jgi:hypothetical protein
MKEIQSVLSHKTELFITTARQVSLWRVYSSLRSAIREATDQKNQIPLCPALPPVVQGPKHNYRSVSKVTSVSIQSCVFASHVLSLLPVCCCFLLSLILKFKVEAKCSSETPVDLQLTTQRYIPEDRILHSYHCEILKSYDSLNFVTLEVIMSDTIHSLSGGFFLLQITVVHDRPVIDCVYVYNYN